MAFVATVYGVGAANLFFLPLANKMKLKLKGGAGVEERGHHGPRRSPQGENPRHVAGKARKFPPSS